MTVYRLEYNEAQQCFHHENLSKKAPLPENNLGWKTLGIVEENRINYYTDYLEKQCKIDVVNRESKVKFKEVERTWKNLHELLNDAFEIDMDEDAEELMSKLTK